MAHQPPPEHGINAAAEADPAIDQDDRHAFAVLVPSLRQSIDVADHEAEWETFLLGVQEFVCFLAKVAAGAGQEHDLGVG